MMPQQPQPEPVPETPSLADLPGIELTPVLELLGGDEALFSQLLTEFIDEFGQLSDEIRQALERGDRETLRRRLHSFKGTASNLGLKQISQQAAALEMAIRTDQPASALFADFNATYTVLLPSLRDAARAG